MKNYLLAVAAAILAAQPASAATFSFNFNFALDNGDVTRGSGTLFTDEADADGRYRVTGASGGFYRFDTDRLQVIDAVSGPYDPDAGVSLDAYLFNSDSGVITLGLLLSDSSLGDDPIFFTRDLAGPYRGSISIESFFSNGSLDLALLPEAAAVPEPATWGMMLAGFGLAGGTLRARRRRVAFA